MKMNSLEISDFFSNHKKLKYVPILFLVMIALYCLTLVTVTGTNIKYKIINMLGMYDYSISSVRPGQSYTKVAYDIGNEFQWEVGKDKQKYMQYRELGLDILIINEKVVGVRCLDNCYFNGVKSGTKESDVKFIFGKPSKENLYSDMLGSKIIFYEKPKVFFLLKKGSVKEIVISSGIFWTRD